jgi:hypothetical protein
MATLQICRSGQYGASGRGTAFGERLAVWIVVLTAPVSRSTAPGRHRVSSLPSRFSLRRTRSPAASGSVAPPKRAASLQVSVQGRTQTIGNRRSATVSLARRASTRDRRSR